MLPLRDLNPTQRIPIANFTLIAINILVYFLFQAGLSMRESYALAMDWAVVPVTITRAGITPESLLDIVRAMFMHGSIAHLAGNMLYLWIFGDNLEDRMGIPLYLLFYFACGFAATFAQIAIDPASDIPMLGASGAIAGVLGGYLVLFPRVRVRGLIFFGYFARMADLSALWVLGFWFVLQLLEGFASLGSLMGGGVAFFAHIGGFVAGVVLMWLFMLAVPQPPHHERHELLYQRYDARRGRGGWY
ncbi:MAG: rhomboid family intramembrane serine protease [Anaerolineae bacterium]|nr:rhomboid family intramembrane serine protease [Anaerolineae bacterium]